MNWFGIGGNLEMLCGGILFKLFSFFFIFDFRRKERRFYIILVLF